MLITALLIYYSLAGLGSTVRRTLVHLLFRRLPCHRMHRGRRGARCSLFCLPVVVSSSLPLIAVCYLVLLALLYAPSSRCESLPRLLL